MLNYMIDRLGFYGPNDTAYVMDDYGNAVSVPYCLYVEYFQEAD